MTRLIERVLRLERGDLTRALPLVFYLFLIMASFMMARITRTALFLDKFDAEQLPFVDITIAVLVGFVVAGYIRVGRGVSLRNLLLGSLFIYAAIWLLFWWLAYRFELPWLFPVIYVWVGMFGVLAVSQVWTLANYMLTTREAKRVFGVLASGATLGATLGGLFAKMVADKFGTESLFLAMAAAMVLCAGLVVLIWLQRRTGGTAEEERRESASQDAPRNLLQSLRIVRGSSYLLAIAGLILVANIVTSLAGWQFNAIAELNYQTKDRLTSFFGNFYFYAGLACLFVQLLLTSRVLRRFGLGPALFVVPVALSLGSVGVLVWGSIWAAIALRGSINVFQYSIDKSTVELLYLPIPAAIKVQVKSFIDTVVWRTGDGLSGVLILVFVTGSHLLSASQMSLVSMVLILGWMSAAWIARGQYVGALRTSVQQHRLDAERAMAPVLDRSATDILAAKLGRADAKEILYALSLFEVSGKSVAHPAVRELLTHPSPEVRQKAISILMAAGDKAVLPQVERLLKDPHLEVRTQALMYLTQHSQVDPLERIQEMGDFRDFSIRSSLVAFLSRPGETQNLETARIMLDGMVQEGGKEGKQTRLEAARLIGTLPDSFDEQLRVLLADPDIEVACEAIQAVAKLGKRRFIPRVMDRLAEPELVVPIAGALAKFGDRIVGTLRDHLGEPNLPLEIRRGIPSILLRINTPAAERVLMENLLEVDTELRFRILSSLNKLHQAHPEFELDTQMIEMVLAAEIMGHYRSYQILGTLEKKGMDESDPVPRALQETMKQEMERIFRLLGLLFPQYDFHSTYLGLQSENPEVHDNALELLDNVLKSEMRHILVPLLDSYVSVAERARLGRRLVGTGMETSEEAVAALMFSEDPWLKSCGAYAIGTLGLKSMEKELDSCLSHPDPLLREAARQAKLRLAGLSEAKTA